VKKKDSVWNITMDGTTILDIPVLERSVWRKWKRQELGKKARRKEKSRRRKKGRRG
jgi:hypothetical protein